MPTPLPSFRFGFKITIFDLSGGLCSAKLFRIAKGKLHVICLYAKRLREREITITLF